MAHPTKFWVGHGLRTNWPQRRQLPYEQHARKHAEGGHRSSIGDVHCEPKKIQAHQNILLHLLYEYRQTVTDCTADRPTACFVFMSIAYCTKYA